MTPSERMDAIRRAAIKAGNPVRPDPARAPPAAAPASTGGGLRVPKHLDASAQASAALPDSRRVHRSLPNFCFVRY